MADQNSTQSDARCRVCDEPIRLGQLYHVVPVEEAGDRAGHYHARCLPRDLENLEVVRPTQRGGR